MGMEGDEGNWVREHSLAKKYCEPDPSPTASALLPGNRSQTIRQPSARGEAGWDFPQGKSSRTEEVGRRRKQRIPLG